MGKVALELYTLQTEVNRFLKLFKSRNNHIGKLRNMPKEIDKK